MSKAVDYGYALYELAAEEGLEEKINIEFDEVAQIFEKNQDFIKLLSNPRIPILDRIHVIDHVFKNSVQSYLLSLLKILVEKKQISYVPQIFKEYRKQYYINKNILPVTVISAVALNENQRKRIIEKLEKSMNKTILLDNKIDPSCIGGIRLEYQGRMIDASIKNRFQKLQLNLKNADYSVAEV
ncbi:MAG: ATP synthase F1 subunit delta [Clostridiales bacterium]|jgi:F-type H+-transporting ATPase subunit delta|nr:ATP synthase F1 subunit delta [Clostridiales bacterium]